MLGFRLRDRQYEGFYADCVARGDSRVGGARDRVGYELVFQAYRDPV